VEMAAAKAAITSGRCMRTSQAGGTSRSGGTKLWAETGAIVQRRESVGTIAAGGP